MSDLAFRPKGDAQGVHKIFVGVDYGTTFTGASWIASTKTSIDDVNVISSWPGPSRVGEAVPKTPSCIAYQRENSSIIKNGNQWGYLVTPKMKSYSWTKLLLDQTTTATKFDDPTLSQSAGLGLLKTPNGVQATQVCTDYLREIYSYVFNELEQRLSPEVLRVTPLEFLFTVPAIWSDKAKQATLDAARQAGFSSRLSDTISLMPEPEAAAIATISAYKAENVLNDLKAGEGILVCDCGGGTVDITTFEIQALEPELKLADLVVGGGGKCGSTNIDRLFHQWMKQKFGAAFESLAYEKKGPGSRFMKDFESRKRDFGSSLLADSCEVMLPMSNVPESTFYDPDESSVIIPSADMRGFFSPVIDNIIALIEDQLAQLPKKNIQTEVTLLILVGGFGDSRYLNDQLRKWSKKGGKIRLICPSDPQAAIMKGAAYCGLRNIVPSRRLCRRHYGFAYDEPFIAGRHDQYQHYYHKWHQTEYVANMLEWPLKKGGTIERGTKITRRNQSWTFSEESKVLHLKLYTSIADPPPENKAKPGVDYLGQIRFDISNHYPSEDLVKRVTSTGELWRFTADVEVLYGEKAGVLEFHVVREGRIVGQASIDFH